MSVSTEQRRLAAIMFTDMVGYSALSQRDDKLALELLEEHRQILRSIFPRFNGVEIKTIGDAFLVEFQSALEAAQCALEIQRALGKRNHDVSSERRIELRIGIHIGDVVHREGDVYGDGVNIASRIQPVAGIGGICISVDVERQIHNSLEVTFEKLAPTELKNIQVPMDLFRVVLPWEKKSDVRGHKSAVREGDAAPTRRKFALIGGLVLLLIIGLGWWSTTQSRRASPSPAPRSAVHVADQKSIAVLPFVDLSQAKDQEYFCDGISEEILDALAKIEGLRVVARTSSFSFKGKNADVSEIAQKLNVQNVLEGSLRREGDRVRITAQLINARDGFHLWSETYERELQGVFAVQDEITRAIVDALKVKLAVEPSARAPQNTGTYDLYLQGLYLSNKSDEESLRKSLTFFHRALDIDPNFARAWTGVAKDWLYLADAYVKPLEAYPKLRDAASKALALDERDPEAHCYLGETKRVLDRDIAGEEVEVNRALQLDRNSAAAHLFLAVGVHATRGEWEKAVAEIREAEKLDPLSPALSSWGAWIYLGNGQIDEAITEAKRTLQIDPNYVYREPYLATAYREKGDYARAIDLYKKAEEATGIPQAGLAITYAKIGRQSDARQILDNLKEISATKYVAADVIATIYVALGETDEAFRWADRAFQQHAAVPYLTPEFRPLRSDPRFADLLRKTGVDPVKALARQEKP
jgi:adenylate cyclase